MMHRVFFTHVLLVVTCLSGFVNAQPESQTMPSAVIEAEVLKFVTAELTTLPEYSVQDVTVNVGGLDPRLQLKACDQPLDKTISSSRPYGSNLSVKVSCRGTHRWTIYVPTQIEQYGEVVILAHPLRRGTILTEQDVTLRKMDVLQAGYGHIRELERAVGMQLKRNVQAGEALRMSHLRAPHIIKRGDRVMMEAGTSVVSVVTTGEALGTGRVGDQIQVRNNKSERIVDARVVAPGRVKVSL